MNKSFSAKVLILLLVVVLGGAVVFFERGAPKKTLKSDVLATVITPASCYLAPEIHKKITDKNALLAVTQKSPQEIKNALTTIDQITGDEKLNTQKKELDILGGKKMNPEKPSDTAYLQAKKKLDGMTKPVVPTEPIVPAEPIVPSKPVLAAAPVVPAKPTVPVAPVMPVEPKAWTTAYQNYIRVLKPAYDAAKKTYDTVTKPAYDKAKQAYDDAVAAKNTYDTVTKPAYNKALAEYNAAVAAKKTYDTVTKPAYDKAKKTYDTAVAAKKIYDDALADYTNLLAQYNQQLSEYTAYTSFKSALDSYLSAVIVSLGTTIDTMEKNACPAKEALCANKIDDDRDGIQDCDDSDCSEDAACKKDIITCREDDGMFRFEHSNGSTDFSGQVFSMWGTDPYTMSYQIEYAQKNIIFRADTYIDGKKIDCPAIVVDNPNPDSEAPEKCEDMLAALTAEWNEDAKYMTCTGPYSFSMSYHFEKPKEEKGLLSSFLKSDAISEMEETTDNTCDTANCFECSSNQTRDINGNCVDIHVGCSSGQEQLADGSCVDSCAAYETRNPISGTCETSNCPEDKEKASDGTCVDACTPPDTRQSDGTCVSRYCGNGTIDEGEECDGGSGCDSSCKKTGYCGNGTVDSEETCDDGNTVDGDGCSASCTTESGYCGDGKTNSWEECDDGNTSDNDGCDSSCKTECDQNSSLWSSFFGINLSWLKSSATGGTKCPIKWCTIKAAQNYKWDAPTYQEDQSCTCKNGLDPYQYETCRCQPTYPWCYYPKWGECVKAKFFRKTIVKLIRGAPKTCAACMTSGAASFAPIPSIPMAADFKLYKPNFSPKGFISRSIEIAVECK